MGLVLGQAIIRVNIHTPFTVSHLEISVSHLEISMSHLEISVVVVLVLGQAIIRVNIHTPFTVSHLEISVSHLEISVTNMEIWVWVILVMRKSICSEIAPVLKHFARNKPMLNLRIGSVSGHLFSPLSYVLGATPEDARSCVAKGLQ
jgi:hypothetical protein